MCVQRRVAHHLLGLIFALFWLSTAAGESCRIAFDMGSSGIRAGSSGSPVTPRADIDYLRPLWAGRGLDETLVPTRKALQELPEQGGFPAGCERVGGGFSAWRLAVGQNRSALAGLLGQLHADSGVAILVIPQLQEGGYGYLGARLLLGDKLRSSHVLDIGGGSLQVAGEQSTYGEALGQKIWHRQLCNAVREKDTAPCELQPMAAAELTHARGLAQVSLAGVASALPGRISMTAISRPVSRGILPAVARLSARSAAHQIRLADLSAAIERLAPLQRNEMAALLGGSPTHQAYLLSDMLLVEGLMRATGNQQLRVAELDLTNLPGLLADDRAYQWGRRYACYLDRLLSHGVEAYSSDPATCP